MVSELIILVLLITATGCWHSQAVYYDKLLCLWMIVDRGIECGSRPPQHCLVSSPGACCANQSSCAVYPPWDEIMSFKGSGSYSSGPNFWLLNQVDYISIVFLKPVGTIETQLSLYICSMFKVPKLEQMFFCIRAYHPSPPDYCWSGWWSLGLMAVTGSVLWWAAWQWQPWHCLMWMIVCSHIRKWQELFCCVGALHSLILAYSRNSSNLFGSYDPD